MKEISKEVSFSEWFSKRRKKPYLLVIRMKDGDSFVDQEVASIDYLGFWLVRQLVFHPDLLACASRYKRWASDLVGYLTGGSEEVPSAEFQADEPRFTVKVSVLPVDDPSCSIYHDASSVLSSAYWLLRK